MNKQNYHLIIIKYTPYFFCCQYIAIFLYNSKLAVYGLYERFQRVRLQAVDSNSNLPATAMELGRNIYYRLIFDKGVFTTGKTI